MPAKGSRAQRNARRGRRHQGERAPLVSDHPPRCKAQARLELLFETLDEDRLFSKHIVHNLGHEKARVLRALFDEFKGAEA